MAQSTVRHEQTLFGALLTLAAGGIDAYSYLFHGEVFAGLQTGNLILMGIHLGRAQFGSTGRYLVSALAFFAGTILIRALQRADFFTEHEGIRRKTVLLYESLMLILIGFIGPHIPNLLATALLSITAAAELQEFRRLNGGPFTPLMMTGNLRTLAEAFFDVSVYHEKNARQKLGYTTAIMAAFVLGAFLIGITQTYLHHLTILIPAASLLGAWIYISRS